MPGGVIVLDGTWSYTGANEVAPNVRLGTVGNDGHYHSGGDHAKQIEVSDSRGFFAGYEVPIDRPITLAIAPGNWPEFQNGEWDSPWNKFYPWIIDCDRGSSGHCGEYMTDQRFAAITAEQAPEIPKTFTAAAGHHYYFDEKGLREWSSWSPNEPCVGPPPYIRNRLAHFHKTIFFSDDLANSMKVVSYSTATNDYNLSYRGLSSENYVEQFGIRYANGAEEANSNYKKYFFGGKRQEYGPLVFFPE